MTRLLLALPLLALAACADSGLQWSDYELDPAASAVARNRAMMVQNPNDLVRARTASGRDGNRAVDVLGKYGRGEATSSAPESLGNSSMAATPTGQGGK